MFESLDDNILFKDKVNLFRLNYYERKNDRYSISKLIEEISKHYSNQLLKQIHVVVLGLDVLGNPFGVIRGVKGGVQSFFYEPYKVNRNLSRQLNYLFLYKH